MRRHVATFVAAAMLLGIAAPALAGDPPGPTAPAESVAPPSLAPPPSAEPSTAPEPSPGSAVDPAPDAGAAPSSGATPAAATPGAPAAPAGEAVDIAADPAGRWIVLYEPGTDAARTVARQGRRVGFTAERTFSHAVRGFTARLSSRQVATLRGDPTVLAVVPDERIELTAQTFPTGINRIGARRSAAAAINGIDTRVNADVAIVDTGIARVADLNVVGGYNCSTSDRTAWRDVHGHGTHVAGTVGAVDNLSGVVGVAPGVRLWAVKILNDQGAGLLSWYVCGLDWIAAQRDPADAGRPLFEAVNMSVAKSGRDDRTCGVASADVLHAAICRVVNSGVTVVAAAANDSANAAARVPAAYDEVITVSALADTDGKPGALGGRRCFSWGTYDDDDTFANFSNYGADVDIIAPGKCIWSTVPGGYQYMSGTSMAAPHVTGAVALLKATRPSLPPAEVREALQYLGNLGWKVTSDPDASHEKLLDVTRLGPRGDFSVAVGGPITLSEHGGTVAIPVTVRRTVTSFERIVLRADGLPRGFRATFDRPTLFGFTATTATMSVEVPDGTASGTYHITVAGSEHGLGRVATATIVVEGDPPSVTPPFMDAQPRAVIGTTTLPVRVSWTPAVDTQSAIGGYELQVSASSGPWVLAAATGPTVRSVRVTQRTGRSYAYRVRARDSVGNWSAWTPAAVAQTALVQDSSAAAVYRGRWSTQRYAYASGGSQRYATAAGALVRTSFTGRAVAIVAPVGPTRGSARVYIDGTYKGLVSFRSTTGRSRLVMYTIAYGAVGAHTIELRLVGNGRVDLDAFVVFR